MLDDIDVVEPNPKASHNDNSSSDIGNRDNNQGHCKQDEHSANTEANQAVSKEQDDDVQVVDQYGNELEADNDVQVVNQYGNELDVVQSAVKMAGLKAPPSSTDDNGNTGNGGNNAMGKLCKQLSRHTTV